MAWHETVALVSSLGALVGLGISWGIAWGSVKTKVDTLWAIFMESTKSRYRNTGLWEEESPRKLGERGKEILSEELRGEIELICGRNPSSHKVISKLGVGRLSRIAEEKGVSLEEVIAAVGIYVEECSSRERIKGPKGVDKG